MYLLLTLTQWMKELPAHPLHPVRQAAGRDEPDDPLREELGDPHWSLDLFEVDCGASPTTRRGASSHAAAWATR